MFETVLGGQYLRITYDSPKGRSEVSIYPDGLCHIVGTLLPRMIPPAKNSVMEKGDTYVDFGGAVLLVRIFEHCNVFHSFADNCEIEVVG